MSLTKTQPPCIAADDLSFAYEGQLVVDHISFTVPHGGYVGIVGPNGGGKTTLIKLLLGLLTPTHGSVVLRDRQGAPLRPSAIGYVPQRISHDAVGFPATVAEVVRSGRTPALGVFGLALTDVAPLTSRLLGELSGGQRQRVIIARALAAEPQLLILDEPTVGVDVAARETFYEFLRQLNRDLGITIIIISHDTDIVAEQVSTVLCINRTLVCHAGADEFLRGNYLEKAYGTRAKRVVHHDHEHE
jgi:zinc transport system ATP-binding protein